MNNTTTYTPNSTGTHVIATIHYADGTHKAITLPRVYDTVDRAMQACVLLTMRDQQTETNRAEELARLGK